ncbi:MAG: hypothetical protein P8K68_07835 [Algibacter sp.]|uniref:hypothetical protein n=1 Tax=Algibacter sp. TaxID=1872428 RepID=UPI002621EBBD|nr:hypothetical protein [Algibacter sp.]MDG1729495.1 hypothetical protein [Algibacter sp.]MDG2178681.1 hypothetical protein [Algibacter sp.]
MKLSEFIFLVLNLIIIHACQPPVVFSEPQPHGKKELATIPKQYRGMYWCKTDSVTLIVNDKTIYKALEFETTLTKPEVDSNPDISFVNGKLYLKELNQSFPSQLKNDSIISQLTLNDTLFNMATDHVAKLFKGHLIINNKLDDASWEVKVLSLEQKNILTIAKAEIPEDFELLKEITDIEQTNYSESNKIRQIKIAPTQKEFNQILKQGLLFDSSCSEFFRMSKDSKQQN